jgi:hypothetical protein
MEKDDNPMMDDGTVDDESIDDSTMDSDDDSDSDDSGDRDDSHERFISDITRDLFDNVKNGFYFHTNSFILCQPETKAAFRAAVRQNHTNRSLRFIADDAGEIWEEWEDDTRNELLQELGSLESLQELYFPAMRMSTTAASSCATGRKFKNCASLLTQPIALMTSNV